MRAEAPLEYCTHASDLPNTILFFNDMPFEERALRNAHIFGGPFYTVATIDHVHSLPPARPNGAQHAAPQQTFGGVSLPITISVNTDKSI